MISNFEILRKNEGEEIAEQGESRAVRREREYPGVQKIEIFENQKSLSAAVDQDKTKRSKITFKSTGLENTKKSKKKISKAILKMKVNSEQRAGREDALVAQKKKNYSLVKTQEHQSQKNYSFQNIQKTQ